MEATPGIHFETRTGAVLGVMANCTFEPAGPTADLRNTRDQAVPQAAGLAVSEGRRRARDRIAGVAAIGSMFSIEHTMSVVVVDRDTSLYSSSPARILEQRLVGGARASSPRARSLELPARCRDAAALTYKRDGRPDSTWGSPIYDCHRECLFHAGAQCARGADFQPMSVHGAAEQLAVLGPHARGPAARRRSLHTEFSKIPAHQIKRGMSAV